MKESDILALFRQFEEAASEYEGIECWRCEGITNFVGIFQMGEFCKGY